MNITLSQVVGFVIGAFLYSAIASQVRGIRMKRAVVGTWTGDSKVSAVIQAGNSRCETLEKIAEAAFEVPEALVGHHDGIRCRICDGLEWGERHGFHRVDCRWLRIQELKKELENGD